MSEKPDSLIILEIVIANKPIKTKHEFNAAGLIKAREIQAVALNESISTYFGETVPCRHYSIGTAILEEVPPEHIVSSLEIGVRTTRV